MEYADHVHKLGATLFEFLSEALGLKLTTLQAWIVQRGLLLLVTTIPHALNLS